MALDGVVDPVAATTSTEAVLASGSADTDRVFRKFLRLCEAAGPDRCALAGHGPAADRVDRFRADLRRRPVPVPSGELTSVLDAIATGRPPTRSACCSRIRSWSSAPASTPTRPWPTPGRAARRLGNAVLLTHDGHGHLSRRDPSTCVVQATGSYLVELTTPAPGTVCPSDRLPFDPDFGQPSS